MLILTVAFNTVAGHRLEHQADDELRTRAAAVATTVDTGGPTVRVLETSHDDLLDANVRIYAGHRLLEGPPGTSPLNPIAGQLAAQHGRHCVTADLDRPPAVLPARTRRPQHRHRGHRAGPDPLPEFRPHPARRLTHPGRGQTRATHQVIGDAAESMRTICDTLLTDAREHTATAPGIAEVVPTLRRLAELLDVPAHLTLTVEGPHLTTGIPPARLERIASPLLTNACRYARSTVTVHAHPTPDGVRLDVIDDAPRARFVITLPPGGVTP